MKRTTNPLSPPLSTNLRRQYKKRKPEDVEDSNSIKFLQEFTEAFPLDDEVLGGSATKDLESWTFGHDDDCLGDLLLGIDSPGSNLGNSASPLGFLDSNAFIGADSFQDGNQQDSINQMDGLEAGYYSDSSNLVKLRSSNDITFLPAGLGKEWFNAESDDEMELLVTWTAEMDEGLREAVLKCGEQAWTSVCKEIRPHVATPLQCLKRWDIIKTRPVKGGWTAEEDEFLKRLVETHGARQWKIIASNFPGRNDKSCRERWLHHLSITVGDWGTTDDHQLLSLHRQYGDDWEEIAHFFPGRSARAVQERHQLLDGNSQSSSVVLVDTNLLGQEYNATNWLLTTGSERAEDSAPPPPMTTRIVNPPPHVVPDTGARSISLDITQTLEQPNLTRAASCNVLGLTSTPVVKATALRRQISPVGIGQHCIPDSPALFNSCMQMHGSTNKTKSEALNTFYTQLGKMKTIPKLPFANTQEQSHFLQQKERMQSMKVSSLPAKKADQILGIALKKTQEWIDEESFRSTLFQTIEFNQNEVETMQRNWRLAAQQQEEHQPTNDIKESLQTPETEGMSSPGRRGRQAHKEPLGVHWLNTDQNSTHHYKSGFNAPHSLAMSRKPSSPLSKSFNKDGSYSEAKTHEAEKSIWDTHGWVGKTPHNSKGIFDEDHDFFSDKSNDENIKAGAVFEDISRFGANAHSHLVYEGFYNEEDAFPEVYLQTPKSPDKQIRQSLTELTINQDQDDWTSLPNTTPTLWQQEGLDWLTVDSVDALPPLFGPNSPSSRIRRESTAERLKQVSKDFKEGRITTEQRKLLKEEILQEEAR